MIVNIVLDIVIVLAALVLGLLCRRLLVRRLAKTVLDKWLIYTLGAVAIALPLILGTIAALAIWSTNVLSTVLDFFGLNKHNIPTLTGNVFQTLLLIGLGIGVARTLRSITIRGLGMNRVDINLRTLIARIFYFLTLVVAGFWILSIWQVPIGIPAAIVGALTVALTVSLQDIIKDLVAGFYILMERPFFIGDQINITVGMITYIGKVQDINLRATKLRLVSGEEANIPNATVFGSSVINNTYYGERRAVLTATLAQTDFSQEETRARILSTLQEVENVLAKPEPEVMISSFTEEKITLLIRFWIASGQVVDISKELYAIHALLPSAEITVREPLG